MQPKIPEPVKAERLKKLQALQDELTIKSMEKLKDKVVEVLIEGISSKQFEKEKLSYRGREPGNRVVNFLVDKEKNKNIGEFVQVKITQIKKHSLFGEVIK
jgi:tRNA-2-methylthio-N6-dimethylallyladenosine synthase